LRQAKVAHLGFSKRSSARGAWKLPGEESKGIGCNVNGIAYQGGTAICFGIIRRVLRLLGPVS